MSYITYAEAVLRYSIIEDWASDESDVSSGLLHYAEVHLDSLLAPCFTVPFVGPPQIIKDLAMDLAYMKALYPRDIEKADQYADYIQTRIDAIKDGKESIVTDSGTIIERSSTAGAEIWSTTMDYPSVHSFLDASDFVTHVSSDQQLAEENARL